MNVVFFEYVFRLMDVDSVVSLKDLGLVLVMVDLLWY